MVKSLLFFDFYHDVAIFETQKQKQKNFFRENDFFELIHCANAFADFIDKHFVVRRKMLYKKAVGFADGLKFLVLWTLYHSDLAVLLLRLRKSLYRRIGSVHRTLLFAEP